MKGYFSQLARSTGLGLQPGVKPAVNNPPQPTGASAASTSEQDAPSTLHVEEAIVFAPETNPNVSESAFENSHAFPAERRRGNFAAPEDINNAGKPGREWLKHPLEIEKQGSRKLEPEKQSPASSPLVSDTRLRERADSESGVRIPERVDSRQETFPHETSVASRQASEAGVALDSSAEPEDLTSLKRAETLGAYLREVREWVASPPAEIEDEGNVFSNRSEPNAWGEPERVVAIDERGARSTHEVETQDFHLSIGTISVVIEEPQDKAVVQTIQAPSPRSQSKTAGRAAGETSRLNRHYIT
jgi:hypothetical protein